MLKKIVAWFFIFIGCGALFVAGSALVLIIAPGTEIFGIRYLNAKASDYAYENNAIPDVSGDIYIETHAVPMTIEYTEYGGYYLSYHQSFVGFTRSKHEKASLDVEVDEKDNLIIKANEMVKWLYAQELGADYQFVLRIPPHARNKSIHIKSKDSDVTINVSKYVGTISVEEYEVVSEGDFALNGSLTAQTFKLHTNKTITIDDKINCTNVDLKSSGGNINIAKELGGNIKAETSVGDVKFVSCKNLEVKTDSGDVKSYTAGLNSVAGSANIKTKSGFVELGNISYDTTLDDENRKLNIVSNSGKVNVSIAHDATITSERGKVFMNEVRKIVLNANVGNVSIKTVYDSAIINGRNGKVELGEGGTINNVKVSTTSGTIKVQNTTGDVDIKSASNAVTFKNLSSEKIKLYSAKTLKASNLQGEVEIYTNGDADLHFAKVSGNVNIETGGKTDEINIDATCQNYSTVNYSLESTKGKKAKLYAGEELVDAKSKLVSNMVEGQYTIKVKTSYGEITLKLALN